MTYIVRRFNSIGEFEHTAKGVLLFTVIAGVKSGYIVKGGSSH